MLRGWCALLPQQSPDGLLPRASLIPMHFNVCADLQRVVQCKRCAAFSVLSAQVTEGQGGALGRDLHCYCTVGKIKQHCNSAERNNIRASATSCCCSQPQLPIAALQLPRAQ